MKNARRQAWVDHLCATVHEENPEAIRFDGLDDALIGAATQHAGIAPVLCYSEQRLLAALAKQFADDNLHDPQEAAQEWYDFNVACLAVGKGTPVIVTTEEVDL